MTENHYPLDEGQPRPTEVRGGDRPSDYIPHERPEGTGGFGLIGWELDEDEDEDHE